MNEEIGPTGEFPQGKISSEDKGEVHFSIRSVHQKILIDFGTDLSWIAMGPDEALMMAGRLIELSGDILKLPQLKFIGMTFRKDAADRYKERP